uniref:Protein Wnt n=1 Tax=Heterorhabditis bacteriophora TaxID=37862 RepID=A0A1I7WBW1_HETBA
MSTMDERCATKATNWVRIITQKKIVRSDIREKTITFKRRTVAVAGYELSNSNGQSDGDCNSDNNLQRGATEQFVDACCGHFNETSCKRKKINWKMGRS